MQIDALDGDDIRFQGLFLRLALADRVGEAGEDRIIEERPQGFDIALGERDGLDVLKTLHGEFPRLGIIMLSVYPENQFALRAMRGGAHAYLNKGCSPDVLFAAIAKVAGGGLYITPVLAELLAQNVRGVPDDEKPPHEALSNREFQVLQLLAQGRSVTQIAQQLALSANTISTYRARIFDKLGLHNPADLFSYAARHKLTA